jgi:hypothetical protein
MSNLHPLVSPSSNTLVPTAIYGRMPPNGPWQIPEVFILETLTNLPTVRG